MGNVTEPHNSPPAPADRSWDWHGKGEATKTDQLLDQGGWAEMARAHAWYDPSLDDHDPPHEKQAYKLPHHEIIDGQLKVVWHGVRQAMQVLAGARGGATIPHADHKAIYDHLARHYEQFDEQPPSYRDLGS